MIRKKCMVTLSVFLLCSFTKAPDKDLYTNYCLSHREYDINVYDLNLCTFETDIPYETGLDVQVVPSCNFKQRMTETIDAVVIHYTNGDAFGATSWWQTEYPGTSAHYLIKRDGSVIQSVPEIYAAFHLGCYWDNANCAECPASVCSRNGTFFDPIENTIAIELENYGPLFPDGDGYKNVWNEKVSTEIFTYTGNDSRYQASRFYEAFSSAQRQTLSVLINYLQSRYGNLEILGHSEIQSSSVDPGPAF